MGAQSSKPAEEMAKGKGGGCCCKKKADPMEDEAEYLERKKLEEQSFIARKLSEGAEMTGKFFDSTGKAIVGAFTTPE
jgi:hypothetical protein